MINIVINRKDKKIRITGHSNDTIACSRVSTITQYTVALFSNSIAIKNYKIENGLSEIEFTKEGESILDVMTDSIYKLKELYKYNIMIVEIN